MLMLIISFCTSDAHQLVPGLEPPEAWRCLTSKLAATTPHARRGKRRAKRRAIALIALAVVFLLGFLFLPLVVVFVEGFRHGAGAYPRGPRRSRCLGCDQAHAAGGGHRRALQSVVGVAAAWAIAKFNFRGKNLLLTLIDLPFSVSPVISGLVYVLLFGAQSARALAQAQ